MTRYQIIYQDGSYSVYGTSKFHSIAAFCEKFFGGVCQFPNEVEQIRRLRADNKPSADIIDFDVLVGEKKAVTYTYGMRLRGFSPGC